MALQREFKSKMLQETGVKESREHVRDGGKLKGGTISRNIGDTARAESKESATKEYWREESIVGRFGNTKAAQETREKNSTYTCENKLHQRKHESHTISDRLNKNVEGLDGPKENNTDSNRSGNKVIGRCPTEATNYFGSKRKRAFRSDPSSDKNVQKLKKCASASQDNFTANFKAKNVEAENLEVVSTQKKLLQTQKSVCCENSGPSNVPSMHDVDARPALPGPSSSTGKTANPNAIASPNKVKATLRLFRVVCRTLEEEKLHEDGIGSRRVDCQAAKILKDNLRHINIKKPIFGDIPGVEVNDQFLYRMELALVGLHRQPQSGIDYVNQGGKCLATSIVASGGYENDVRHPDTLVYVGQGGRVTNKNKEPEDQVLERGNLALKNSIKAQNPVRVLRKTKVTNSFTGKNVETYTYDGVYLVTEYWYEVGPHKKLVYKFWLTRIPGQPKLVYKKLRQI